MKSDELAAETEKLEAERKLMAGQLDALIEKFRPHLVAISEPWMRREVEHAITNNSEVVQGLGLEKIRNLKAKLEALVKLLPVIAEKETADPRDWPHNRPSGTTGYGQGRDYDEPFFNKVFRNTISRVAEVLDEFGMLANRKGEHAAWQKRNGRWQFAFNPGLEVVDNDVTQRFGELHKRYEELVSQLNRKKTELSQAKAKELWDSA